MKRFIVTADTAGVPTMQIPLPLAWDLAKCFNAEEIDVTYDHENNVVRVTFPGWDTQTVQGLLDDADLNSLPACDRLAVWPGLHSETSEFQDASFNLCDAPEFADADQPSPPASPASGNRFAESESAIDPCWQTEHPSTRDTLTQLRVLLQGLSTALQDEITRLVCNLEDSLASEFVREPDCSWAATYPHTRSPQ